MGLPKLRPKITVEEYLEGEKVSPIRHEYLDGEVYAMSGASKRHNRISGNLLEKLRLHLKGADCETFYNEVKLRVKHLNRFYYPDLVVVCGPDEEHDYYISKPTIIVEVLSPSTALTDKREKWFAYQDIEGLKEYVMIEQESERAEVYRKRDDGLWSFLEFEKHEEIELESINFKTPMAGLYE
ncbi:MAG: Uma2 family endonuclease [Acidobacteria bacterium]|nr:Uma2 family endonuclease [Acidobacteriota bacterium]